MHHHSVRSNHAMATDPRHPGRAVPSRRIARLWHLGRATTDLAAGVGLRGLIRLARARGEDAGRIELTPEATRRFTARLAGMRGAVMKLGQLMSMDGADVFTPEAAEIMADLRDRAEPMPMASCSASSRRSGAATGTAAFAASSSARWPRPPSARCIGRRPATAASWRSRSSSRACARALTATSTTSASSPVRLAVLPKGLDPRPMLEEARTQLHREADYGAEAVALEAYRTKLGDDPDFLVPRVHPDLSTSRVLAMDFAEGVPVDRLAGPDFRRAERDRAALLLSRLLLRELFDFGLMQTDPNFSNYLYDAASGRVVLLDFGAANPVDAGLAEGYRRMARAALADDGAGMHESALALGYLGAQDPPHKAEALIGLIRMSGRCCATRAPTTSAPRTCSSGSTIAAGSCSSTMASRASPSRTTLFLHRKFVGTFMLCRRLRARVDLRGMLASTSDREEEGLAANEPK
jgi:aarF domain-containing kinase